METGFHNSWIFLLKLSHFCSLKQHLFFITVTSSLSFNSVQKSLFYLNHNTMSFGFAVKYSVNLSKFKFGFKNGQKPLSVEPLSVQRFWEIRAVCTSCTSLERRLQTGLNQHDSSGRSRCTTTSEHPSPWRRHSEYSIWEKKWFEAWATMQPLWVKAIKAVYTHLRMLNMCFIKPTWAIQQA